MAKKRFTFADAKAKIKALEEELAAAKADVKEDVKKIGYGDVLFYLAGVFTVIIFNAIF